MKMTPHQTAAFNSMKAAHIVCGIVHREIKKGISAPTLLLRAVKEYQTRASEFVGTMEGGK